MITGAVTLVVFTIGVALILAHMWILVPATVSINGVTVRQSRVYKAVVGRILVDVNGESYLVNNVGTSGPSVCSPDIDINLGEFAFHGRLAISEQTARDIPCEAMPGLEIPVSPNLVVRHNKAVFTDADNKRVHVEF